MARRYQVSEGLQSMLNAIAAKDRKITLEDFFKHGIHSATDSIYSVGCVIEFPEKDEIERFIDMDEFTTNGRISRAPYVACNKVYLSQLTRTVMPYVEENGKFVQRGEAVHGSGELYDKCKQARSIGDILNLVMGKKVEVYQVRPVQTARYTNGVIIGLRNAQVPCFRIKE